MIHHCSLLFVHITDMKEESQSFGSLIMESVLYYINHSILLILFFNISIYKNIQYIYRIMCLKLINLAYYPNKTPQIIRDDVNKLTKIPKRLSCIVNLKDEDDENGGVDGLINDISEIVAWTLSSGIPQLSIYEYNNIIKDNLEELNRYIAKNLKTYFGQESIPNYRIRLPHANKVINNGGGDVDLEINILSRIDGKPTMVELTKTMSELANNDELQIQDISIDLINEELIELVGVEPDLVVCFSPILDLQDYPPWHIRLSEIYWEPDNTSVNYAVFIRALQKFSNCKINVGA